MLKLIRAASDRPAGKRVRASHVICLGFSPDWLRKKALNTLVLFSFFFFAMQIQSSHKTTPRLPQRCTPPDYQRNALTILFYVAYKSINNIMDVAGNRIRDGHITSHTTVTGIPVYAAIQVPCGLNVLSHASFGCHAPVSQIEFAKCTHRGSEVQSGPRDLLASLFQ